jgi:EAL domain-containing protein (putative c-di-GMP-specific phosphodiesterase class I)
MNRRCAGCKEGSELAFAIRTAFQPIVDLETGRPFAYEALVRGENGEGASEVLARVNETNRYAFDQACRVTAIREAVSAGLLESDARLSINFLPNAVYSPAACIQLTLRTALETGLPTDRLIFEFTENEQIDTAHARNIIEAYRALGFATAIDDFGAGHAGLGLLANLQTDLIKIDMELIRGIDASVPRRQIVECITRLSRDMGLIVIAEGIETSAELMVLRDIGIRYVQGFVFGRPTLGALPRVSSLDFRAALAA